MSGQMKIYRPMGEDGYELCHPLSEGDFERINVEINGRLRRAAWTPIPVRLIQVDQGRRLARSDAPWLGDHALIFRDSVVAALSPMLEEDGELLPLECRDVRLRLYNPTRVIDALDEGASSVLRLSDGRIMWIRRHVFRPAAVGNVNVFKIPNLRVSPTFVGQRFVDQWNANGLTGIRFELVWPPLSGDA